MKLVGVDLPGIYGVGQVCMMLNKQSRYLEVWRGVVVHENPTVETRHARNTANEALLPAAVSGG